MAEGERIEAAKYVIPVEMDTAEAEGALKELQESAKAIGITLGDGIKDAVKQATESFGSIKLESQGGSNEPRSRNFEDLEDRVARLEEAVRDATDSIETAVDLLVSAINDLSDRMLEQ